MALRQIDALQLGPVIPGSETSSAQLFSSTVPMAAWSSGTSYAVNNAVESAGAIYRSLVGSNLGNTPSSSPSEWLLILSSIKDGDVCYVVAGYLSDINIRINGTWTSILGLPTMVNLANNTSGQVAQFPLSIARAATIQYSITNGGPNRVGTLRWNSDGTIGLSGVALSDFDNVDINGDVMITFDAQVDGTGTYVQLLYTSTSTNGSPAQMNFTMQQWN